MSRTTSTSFATGFNRLFAWQNGQGPWARKGSSSSSEKNSRAKARGTGTGPRAQAPSQPELEDMVNQMRERFDAMLGRSGSQQRPWGTPGPGGGGSFRLPGGFGPEWLVGLVAAIWFATGFYIVAPEEEGVVTRFGAYQYTTGPGLNFHAPWPFESVQKIPVQRVNQIAVGFRQTPAGVRDVLAESLMLTGDQNIVDLDFTVQWRVTDPAAFLFNLSNPEQTVVDAAESVMRETIGRHSIDDALTNNKVKITNEARESLQQTLDRYGAGVRVVGVQLQQVNPPAEVIEAFRDVQTAAADAEKLKNEAMGYANQIVPLARGEAAQLVQQAEAYKVARVAQAEGDAARFNAMVEGYQAAPGVTRQRLYLETMQEVLPNVPKVITTGRGTQSVLPYLPLDRLPQIQGQGSR